MESLRKFRRCGVSLQEAKRNHPERWKNPSVAESEVRQSSAAQSLEGLKSAGTFNSGKETGRLTNSALKTLRFLTNYL